MSAYRQIKTQISDQDLLKECLEETGFAEVESHEKAVQLVGYRGDKRKDTAEVVVRRKHVGSASNDIGFKKDADGNFEAVISEYDQGQYNDKWLGALQARYARKFADRTLRNEGFSLEQTQDESGKITLRYVRT